MSLNWPGRRRPHRSPERCRHGIGLHALESIFLPEGFLHAGADFREAAPAVVDEGKPPAFEVSERADHQLRIRDDTGGIKVLDIGGFVHRHVQVPCAGMISAVQASLVPKLGI